MSKKETIEFLLQECEFTVDEDGYFSGSAQFQLTNLPDQGLVAQAYLKMQKQDSVVLVSDISEGRLSEGDDTLYVGVSGMLDGNATPDSFFLNYRVFHNIDSIETTPSLPSSFGEQSLSVSPKGLLGGKKWKGGGNREVSSVLVLNDEGDFSVSTNVRLGKTAADNVGLFVENVSDGVSDQFTLARGEVVSIKNQHATGAETLRNKLMFYKPDKWVAVAIRENIKVSQH